MSAPHKKKLVAPVAGKSRVIIKKWGKHVFYQDFKIKGLKKSQEFLLYGSATYPVVIFALTPLNKVIVERQFRYAANTFLLELPGGSLNESQRFEKTLREELKAETGFIAKKIVRLGDPLWYDPASLRIKYRAALALGCVKVSKPKHDPSEVMDVLLYPIAKWVEMIMDGRIADDKTVAVTNRALHHLGWRMTPPKKESGKANNSF